MAVSPPAPTVAVATGDANVAGDGSAEVPAISGMPLDVASELLRARGLRLVVRKMQTDAEVAAGSIVAQDPLPASVLPTQSAVSVTLSSGKPADIPMPDLSGKSIEEASRGLQAVGLQLGPIEGPKTGERVVVGTEPAAGRPVSVGSAVALRAGPVGVPVPKLLGLSYRKAKEALLAAGLKPGKVRERYNEDRRAWTVLHQTPAPETIVEAGSSVDIIRNEGD